MENIFKNKTILITGGAGSIGSMIVKKLLEYDPLRLRVFDNNEDGLFNLEREINSARVRYLIGDVRDPKRLQMGLEGVDVVFHTAALKQVPLCEYNPFEAVKTNVIGTQNVIDACLNTEVKKMINISTDKAVSPINVMGATKLLTERLTTTADRYKGKKDIIFASARFGNVLNSKGSVIPLFHQQIKKGGPVTVTNLDMKRFVMSIATAVNLVFKVTEMAKGGEIFILKMPVLRISDLAEVMIEELAPKYNYKPEQIKIEVFGERKGEKLSEELVTEEEIINAQETKEMFIIDPYKKENAVKNFPQVSSSFNNKNYVLSKKEIKELIKTFK